MTGVQTCALPISSYATLLGCEVDVLGGHRAGHREVLEDGGEEEE